MKCAQVAHCTSALVGAAALLLMQNVALAYTGPGAGLSAIGSLLALVAAVSVAIVGFIWYPIKRFLRKSKSVPAQAAGAGAKKQQAEPTSPE